MDSLQNIKVYLWYSVILFFPPVHELGHVIIAKLIGEQVVEMQWNYIYVLPNSLDYFHGWWEYSQMLIPVGCIILYIYLFIRTFKKKGLRIRFGRRVTDAF